MEKLVGRICRCVRYRDYESAIFLASCATDTRYSIVLPILLYLNGEYSRALFHLHRLDTYTSKYYEALCYRRRKEYKKAVKSLEAIVERRTEKDADVDLRIREMLVDPEDTEFVNALLGDLHTLSGNRDEAILCYSASFCKSPLFSATESLILENRVPLDRNMGDVERDYVRDCMALSDATAPALVKRYLDLVPGVGSYFVSNAARKYFDLGQNEKSKQCFDVLRKRDPMFLHNIDYYSTALWHYKDVTELGALCKNLIKHVPDSPNTWKALGNFYSHQGDYQRSVLCLKRSLHICEDSYAYTLLGYESIQRNEYDTALRHFNVSLKMLNDNYRAMFGCGLVYMKTEKLDNAEFFLRRAVEVNADNLQVKVHAMKFYTKRGLTDQSIRLFGDAFRLKCTDVHKLVEHVVSRGGFSEVEEFLLLEFVELLVLQNLTKLAGDVLNCIEYRGDSYCRKKELLMDKME